MKRHSHQPNVRFIRSGVKQYQFAVLKGMARMADVTGKQSTSTYARHIRPLSSDGARVAQDWRMVGNILADTVSDHRRHD